jgi:hypothetical protein
MINHTECEHESTSTARAACRKARASKDLATEAFINDLYTAMPANDGILGHDWLLRGASSFANLHTADRRMAAIALIAYFGPSGDDATDDNRRRNGYTITTDAYAIRRIILRRAS